jgi:hypothetical protein
MGTDFTGARVNGKNVQIAVCANEDTVMYFAREHKGHKGVEGTPVEDYQGILVHDHDMTFYSYGSKHQECMAHILRYLKASMDNEPKLKWNKQMHELLRQMIHYRNSTQSDADIDSDYVKQFESKYMAILETAKDEYDYEPPSDYYKDGFNLFKRLRDFKDTHLLFLYDKRVPPTNNLSERLLRIFKRKQKQVMTFRSSHSLEYLCDCLGVMAKIRNLNVNLFSNVALIFE